jgi:hypothetical protein
VGRSGEIRSHGLANGNSRIEHFVSDDLNFPNRLVQRSKTLPKGAATFVADCLARDSYMLTQHNRDEVTAELLGIDAAAVHTAVSDLPEGSDNRALVIALALVLGSLEARLCGVSRSVHCSVVLPRLGGSVSGAARLVACLQ